MTPRALALVAGATALTAVGARADVLYQVENLAAGSTHEFFNNSVGVETEDCWVANSFQVSALGTHITQLQFLVGGAAPNGNGSFTNVPIIATLYTGSSLTNPNAGSGLQRIVSSTTNTTFSSAPNQFFTINLANPVDLPVGQIFYAALLIRGVSGADFPYSDDSGSGGGPPLGRSFFDVGPTQGGAYDLDVTSRAVVLGANQSVLGGAAQSPGNLAVRVVATPEPGALGLIGLAALVAVRRRR